MNKETINGYTCFHNQTSSKIINVRASVPVGSYNEVSKEEYGIAHVLEHMLFKGSKDMSSKEVNEKLSELGSSNGYTCETCTAYYVNTLRDRVEETFALLTSLVITPNFSQKELDKEKTVILEELQFGKDSPVDTFWYEVFEQSGGDIFHRVIGLKEAIKNVTIEQLKAWHKKYYSCLQFSIEGNISKEEAISIMQRKLTEFKTVMSNTSVCESNHSYNFNNKDYTFMNSSDQTWFAMVWQIPGAYTQKKATLELLANILGGDMHSLLFNRIREELGLCYSIATYIKQLKHQGLFIIYGLLDDKNTEKAITEINTIISNIIEVGIDKDILDISKKNSIFTRTCTIESKLPGFVLDNYFINGHNLFNYDNYVSEINNCTEQDLQTCAKRYLEHKPKIVIMRKD